MPKFTTEKILHYSPEEMFNLVADIEKYPEFVPMCEDLKIYSQEKKDKKLFLLANMIIGYKFIRENFTTTVLLDYPEKRIDVHYVDGPFQHLENIWNFYEVKDNPNACRVSFFIDYSFKNPMFSMLLSNIFDKIFKNFITSFEEQANIIYKKL